MNQEILELLKYTIPSLIVFFTTFFTVRWYFKTDQEKRRHEIKLLNERTITPIRLQAYERLILFLERISPDSLIMRLSEPNMTAGQLQNNMLISIRAEFEHNLSQQLYISNQAWEVIKSAKTNLIKIINTAADKVKPNDSAIELSKIILESMMEVNKSPTTVAIEFLKKELQLYL
jgi:hypothetical protein